MTKDGMSGLDIDNFVQ